ncbi:peptidoglycan recognition protein [Actinopolymorpha sp. B9G3]|uniref:peptidoglycan recognition protein family protein n=1 Tax=Actinopolymorpha sp. B9G3 TaxID=3158970 RepID=UPI0032D95B1D
MLGVTWAAPRTDVTGTMEVRTRDARSGEWSAWRDLDIDDGHGDGRPGTRGGTEPIWVGPSDGVQARVRSAEGSTSEPPKGLRLDMVATGVAAATDTDGTPTTRARIKPAAFVVEDPTATATPTPSDTPTAPTEPTAVPEPTTTPTTTPTPTSEPTQTPTATQTPTTTPTPTPTSTIPTAPPSTVPKPPITLRAQWGADESIVDDPPTYQPNGVKAVVIHHTVDSNSYSCADSPEIIQAIQRYHVNGRGWNDIGYQFLVDKCGTLFEGRAGGVDRPVLGAQAYAWNTETTGIAFLGDFRTASPTTKALTSAARLAAWKLGQYSADPGSTVMLTAGDNEVNYYHRTFTKGTSYSFTRVVGHRNLNTTECPSAYLYPKVSTIRTWASGPVQGLAVTSVSGAGKSGTTYYTKGNVTVGWTTTTPSSLISKFEVLVDGAVAATASRSARSAQVTLPPGTRKLAVRAVHQSGKPATTPAVTVVAETTPPTFSTAPKLLLRKGTVNTSAVPMALAWRATDNTVLKQVALTAPVTATYGPTVTRTDRTMKSGTATTWTLKPSDYAGNTTTGSVSATPVILQESSAVRSGTWKAKYSSNYLGGKSYTSATKGSSLTWTFTGRSVAWIVSRASGSGQAYVYLDGTKVATIDLKSTTTKYRNAIWTKYWTSNAKHTVKIVVVGTSGRPTITTDGLAYLK